MANPFLVLGGIAISVATAAFGILQVPGWVASAQDGAATNDLALIAEMQALAASQNGSYASSLSSVSGAKMTQSTGVNSAIAVSPARVRWGAVTVSESGRVFVRVSDSTKVFSADRSFAPGDSIASASKPGGVTLGGTAASPTITVTDEVPLTGWTATSRNELLTPNPRTYTGSLWIASGTGAADAEGGIRSVNSNQTSPKPTWILTAPNTDVLKAGEPVTLAVTYRVDEATGGGGTHVGVAPHDRRTTAQLLGARSVVPLQIGTTQRVVIHWTPEEDYPAGAVDICVYISTPEGAYAQVTTATYAAREAVIERGRTAGTYYDGDTPADQFSRYRWDGTPGASVTIQETRAVDTNPR